MRLINIEKGKISDLQLILLIATEISGSIIALSFMDIITHHDSWLVVLSAYAVSIPLGLSCAFLAKRFPGKNIIQINDIIYGSYVGKIISTVYICFFLLIFSLDIRDISNFYIGFIMPETPMLAFLIILTLTCAYAVSKGIEVISRVNIFILVFIGLDVIGTFTLLLNKVDLTNFLPVFDIPLKTYIQGTHIMLAVSFSEIIVFLMIMPCSSNYKGLAPNTFYALSIAALIFFIVSALNTAVLGPSSTLLVSASYQSARLIDIRNIITRIDLFVAIAITLNLFIKICVLYFVTVAGISQILNLRSYSTLILPIGGIAVIIAVILFSNEITHFFIGWKYYPVFVFPVECIIPPLSLLIAKIRGLPKQTGGGRK